MNKCKNCGNEFDGKFCSNCGASAENIAAEISDNVANETAEVSAEEKALIENIKRDWYEKTWRKEKPKQYNIVRLVQVLNTIAWFLAVGFIVIAFYKFYSIEDELKKSLFLSIRYDELMNSIYLFIALCGVVAVLMTIAGHTINYWSMYKINQWHDGLKIDTRKVAVDIVLSGKSQVNYRKAVAYLYNKAHGVKYPLNNKKVFAKRVTCKDTVVNIVIRVCIVVILCVVAGYVANNLAEIKLKRMMGINNVVTSFSSNMTEKLILIVLLVVLIIALLVVPYMATKKAWQKQEEWIDEQIKKGTLETPARTEKTGNK